MNNMNGSASSSRQSQTSSAMSSSYKSRDEQVIRRTIKVEGNKNEASSLVHPFIENPPIKTSFFNAPTTTDEILPFDIESMESRFSWEIFESCLVPCIKRVINGEHVLFVSVHIAETDLLCKHLNLHEDVYTCVSIKSYFISEHEANILNEINKITDYTYGKYVFVAGKDLIVTLEDAQELYTFVDVCSKMLACKITPGHNDKCGFIRINSEPVVPYCTKDGKQFLPTFYFEGDIEIVETEFVKLENWSLAYLKFCFKVQGVKYEYINVESCQSIDLDIIKTFYPPETMYEKYWPSNSHFDSHHLSTKRSNYVPGFWVRAPSEAVHDENTISLPINRTSTTDNTEYSKDSKHLSKQIASKQIG